MLTKGNNTTLRVTLPGHGKEQIINHQIQ